MAEYYPLIARAVATMRDAPAEQRKAIYDRARGALLGQLRSMQPPVPEASVMRESNALDEAIARVEAEIAGTPAAEPPEAPPAPEPEPEPTPPSPAQVSPDPVTPPAAPVFSEVASAEKDAAGRPARPAADALSRIVAERPSAMPVLRATRDEEEPARNAPPLPSAARLQVPTFSEVLADAARRTSPTELETPEAAAPAPPREEVLRPAAPRPTTREAFNPRALILAAVAIAVMAGIGYVAWRLRDRPEQLARARAAMIAAKQAEPEPAKVVTRAGGGTVDTAPPAASATPSAPPTDAQAAPGSPAAESGSAATKATETSPPAAEASAGASVATGPGTAAEPSVPAAPVAASSPGIAVAQRAAFLVDAPDDPQKIKTYVGNVVWSTENTTPTANAPIARAVRAEVDVPDAGMKMSLVFQKNFEPQFPASHTLELRFTATAASVVGGVKQISVPQMRKDDSQTGDPLIGLPVTITDNYFLVGLSRGDATQRNLDLIQSRNWFDVPLLLNSGKIAKVTFEKGTAGQNAIADVVASWQ